MTEEEWLARRDPVAMSNYVRGKGSERKHRLLACACCEPYRKRHFEQIEGLSESIDVALQAADRIVNDDQREQALARTSASLESIGPYDFYGTLGIPAWACGNREQIEAVPGMILDHFAFDIYANARRIVGPLLSCVFGNPFRRITFNWRWRTIDVLGVARAIYEDRAFERMPILADALMDAGCADLQIIEHCRGNGPHVRGCWVVDLVMGKE